MTDETFRLIEHRRFLRNSNLNGRQKTKIMIVDRQNNNQPHSVSRRLTRLITLVPLSQIREVAKWKSKEGLSWQETQPKCGFTDESYEYPGWPTINVSILEELHINTWLVTKGQSTILDTFLDRLDGKTNRGRKGWREAITKAMGGPSQTHGGP